VYLSHYEFIMGDYYHSVTPTMFIEMHIVYFHKEK
jgi:hypothetical protein